MALAEVSLRLQYVTEGVECGCEPFTLTVTEQRRLTSKVGTHPHVQTMKGLLDSPSWTKGQESGSIVPSSHLSEA